MKLGFWLRWSWRDLRSRWLQVVAIALIIAMGTGVYAGLGGQERWRVASYDHNYALLNMYDLRLSLTEGSFLPQEELQSVLAGIDGVQVAEPRLVTPTLVDASNNGEDILVKGRIIGVDVSDGGPHVNGIFVDEDSGRTLTAADSGQPVAILEYKFADYYGLQPGDPLRVSGDIPLELVGMGHSPEYFMIIPDTGVFFAQSTFAVVFVPLETAQGLIDSPGLVNEAVMILNETADARAVEDAIEQQLETLWPDVGYDINETADDSVYATLYSDAKGDQIMWNAIAFLFLIGAALGAFNLAGRMVESQRRQIGIGMALGVPRYWLAFRPILVGLQIALLGTVFGLIFGLGLGELFSSVMDDFAPLPEYKVAFYPAGFARAVILGILIPFAATIFPVWRAVRVAPIDAIQTGHLIAKGGGLTGLAAHLPLPGRSFTHMPIKNLLRSPRRALLTVFGLSIAIMLMTVMVGVLDTYLVTMDQADEAFRHEGADRVLVQLDNFYPVENSHVTAIGEALGSNGSGLVSRIEPALALGGILSNGDVEVETALEMHDMANAIWTPALVEGSLESDEAGVIISRKMASDLGVDVGDPVTLTHPLRTGLLMLRLEETDVPVIGIHDNPLRPLTYMDMETGSALMGLEGITNQLVLSPEEGVSDDAIKRALLTQPGVASVEAISEFSEAIDELLELVTGILAIVAVVVVVMSFLIAFNSTTISVDERVREIATMFACGLPIRTVTRMQIIENFVIGVLGTILGIVLGLGIVYALFTTLESPEVEDFYFIISLQPASILMAFVLGVVVVTLTPIVSVRKMLKMDIPSTLRVME